MDASAAGSQFALKLCSGQGAVVPFAVKYPGGVTAAVQQKQGSRYDSFLWAVLSPSLGSLLNFTQKSTHQGRRCTSPNTAAKCHSLHSLTAEAPRFLVQVWSGHCVMPVLVITAWPCCASRRPDAEATEVWFPPGQK